MIYIRRLLVLSILLMFFVGMLPLSSALVDVTVNLTYDRNGNLMQDANYYYQYNSEHQLSKVRDKNATGRILAEYWYDHLGERLKKVVYHEDGSNTTTYYVNENFVREIGPDGVARDTIYYYDDEGVLLARQDSDGKKYFYHPDALGSTALVTDEAGNVVEEVEYLPFGEVIEGGNDRYLFTGKEKDRETGLQYYNARYYAPDQARFIQPDSVQPNVYDPQQLNKYSYARNNPVKYTDPDGQNLLLAVGGIFVVGAFDVAYFAGYAGNIYDQVQNMEPNSMLPWYDNVNWDEAHSAGKELGTDAAVAIGAELLLHQAALKFSGSSLSGSSASEELARLNRGANSVSSELARLNKGANPKAGVTVLGDYESAVELGRANGWNYLDVDYSIYQDLEKNNKWWTLNQQFLDEAIARGDKIRFSRSSEGKLSKGFQQEIDYLDAKGYIIDKYEAIKKPR
ncbi:hypothetical protein HYW21_00965 [Candidatus Woesearchaeota archaeon]|nr:hypothetical protein [Candidatus Woesearchaeota archaeon]